MIEKSSLDTGSLPDGTARSQKPAGKSPAAAADLKRGYIVEQVERIPIWSAETTGEDPVGDPFTYGGILGRPRGTQR